jgi:hypothetical protein
MIHPSLAAADLRRKYLHYLPETKIVVPLLVQMGALDTEPAKDCISRLQEQGQERSRFLCSSERNAWIGINFTKKGINGQNLVYRSNPKAKAVSVRLAFDFLDSHVRKTGRQIADALIGCPFRSKGDIGGRLTLSANALYVGQVVTWAAAKLPH